MRRAQALATRTNGLPVTKKFYATKLIKGELVKVQSFLTENGWAIGYAPTRPIFPRKRRVHLGFAMGCVKDEDAILPMIFPDAEVEG